ncbi:MAG: OmpA family protein [Chitinispirillales bacterium]|nr:OmpA family protein [Chitinispirillales bacterium]
MNLKKFCLSALLSCAVLTNQSFSNTGTDIYDEGTLRNVPSTSYWGTRGLSQTAAAEPLGADRLNISISGTYSKPSENFTSGRHFVNTNVVTSRVGVSYGIRSNVDAFLFAPFYGNSYSGNNYGPTLGGFTGGLAIYPTPQTIPFRLGAQVYAIQGFKHNNDNIIFIDEKNYNGYDFFDTQEQTRLAFKLTQSLVAGENDIALKLHFNEAYVMNFGKDKTDLLLLAAGLQIDPNSFLTIGFELNSRTNIKKPNLSDPLWFTPSIMFRTPYNTGFLFGSDIAVSKKTDGVKPLESYRLFGDIVISFDVSAGKRAEAAEKRREELAARAELERQAQELADQKASMAQKMEEDSIRSAQREQAAAERAYADSIRAKAVADSLSDLAGSLAQKAHDDSVAMAEAMRVSEEAARQQREADSIVLAETKKRLDEERARRTEAEQSFLSTGMLTLDNAVQFQSGRTDIPHNAKPYLTIIAKMLVKYPKLKIEIGGHTDNIGRMETNMSISQKRAESVYHFMLSTEPKLVNSLSAKGYGPTMPKADNNSADGRQTNRRIELKVLNPEVLQEYNP